MERSAEGLILRVIAEFRREISEGDLTLGEIFEILKTSGHDLLILFMCLPFLQPLPLLGLSTPLGMLMALSAIQKYRGRSPWIPSSWKKHNFSGPLMIKTLEVADRVLRRSSRFLRPRWPVFLTAGLTRVLSLLVVVSCAILLSMPLPIPFSNTVPTVVIVVNILGQLEEDGIWVLTSYFLFLLCLGFFGGVALGVKSGIGLLGF